jgi:hypothetical protein
MDSNSSATRHEGADATHELLAAVKKDAVAMHERTLEAIKKAGGKSSMGWDVLKVVLPILLTTVLGFWVWYTQSKIQSKVDENSRLLSMRLALTEEFYRRKLDRYEATCKEIARLEESLERYGELEVNPEVGVQAADSMIAVDRLRKSDFLFLTDKFKSQLGDLWEIGRNRMMSSGEDNDDLKKKLREQIKSLKEEMNVDLNTSDLTWRPKQSDR